MKKIVLLSVLTVASTTTTFASIASADEASDTATARSLGVEGVTLAEAGKCGEAMEKLDRAEKLHHAPTTATRLAECEIETGRLVSGTERLQRVIRERIPANAHPAFAAAQTRAQGLLDKTLPRLAAIRVSVTGGKSAPALVITIDGERTSDAILDTDRKIDPGTHTIEVKADGYYPAKESATLKEGESKSLRLELKPDLTSKPVPHPTPSERAGTSPSLSSSTTGSKVPAIALFGVSAVGLGLGIYSATVVGSKSSRLQNECDGSRVCPPGLSNEISEAKTWATISTVSFIGSGVAAAAGIVLFITADKNTRTSTTASAVRLRPTASGAVIDGVF